MSTVSVRRILDPEDQAVEQFGELQLRTYADQSLLIPPQYFAPMLRNQREHRHNLMLVAEDGDRVVGGALFHYFPAVNTGFSSFMAVDADYRGRGVARALHEGRFAYLDAVAGRQVHGVFIDVEDPVQLSAEKIAEERWISVDPFQRRKAFARLGFRKVGIDYYQPSGRKEGRPLTLMDLLYCPHQPVETVPTELVAGTMYYYWLDWLGQEIASIHAAKFREMAGGPEIPLHMP